MRRVAVALGTALTAILLFAGGGWLYMKFGMHGFSARAEPSHMEAMMAEYARDKKQRKRSTKSSSLMATLPQHQQLPT